MMHLSKMTNLVERTVENNIKGGTKVNTLQQVVAKKNTTLRKFTKTSLKLKGPNIIDLIKIFPLGLTKLYNDYQQYQNIKDATNTTHNAWWSEEKHCAIPPRRQQEQERRFLRDIRKVLLPVTIASVPIAGYSVLFLAAVRPYVFLSEHFFTYDQIRYFVSLNYDKRKGYFDTSFKDLCRFLNYQNSFNDLGNKMEATKLLNDDGCMISFGNVFPLYSRLQERFSNPNDLLEGFTRKEIMNITNSSRLSSVTLCMQPTILIRYRLRTLIQDIVQDDLTLIQEKHHLNNCNSLTINEIVDACSLRSLPCGSDQTLDFMRVSLCEHLRNVNQILNHVGEEHYKRSNATAYLILYLPIIRQQNMLMIKQ